MRRSLVILGFILCAVSLDFQTGAAEEPEIARIEEGRIVVFREFIEEAARKDTEFEAVLIDELKLRYEKDLQLPAGDLVFSVKEEHDVFVDAEHEAQGTTAELSTLFPLLGTELEAAYEVAPKSSSTEADSELSFSISQPIAQNAFGHSTRLLDRIVDIEINIARHQIVEAYEDYLAVLTLAYLEWYESWENLKIGLSSHAENLKLLDNIKERQKSKIADPIDVNKVMLQVTAKKEKLLDLEEKYQRSLNVVRTALRLDLTERIVPHALVEEDRAPGDFEEEYQTFRSQSRTYEVLDSIEKKSALELDRAVHDLLPSIDLMVGYSFDGTDYALERSDRLFYAALSAEWPFPDQVDRAESEVAKIEDRKTKLTVSNTHYRLRTNLRNLHLEIAKEKELASIAQEKIRLAREVLDDETENYTFGRVSLNDYIQAVNALDDNRFAYILHSTKLRKLTLEWNRLTDQLVHKTEFVR